VKDAGGDIGQKVVLAVVRPEAMADVQPIDQLPAMADGSVPVRLNSPSEAEAARVRTGNAVGLVEPQGMQAVAARRRADAGTALEQFKAQAETRKQALDALKQKIDPAVEQARQEAQAQLEQTLAQQKAAIGQAIAQARAATVENLSRALAERGEAGAFPAASLALTDELHHATADQLRGLLAASRIRDAEAGNRRGQGRGGTRGGVGALAGRP
jgi:F0F1-type ATP synthase membrane subunit b/b'